MRLRASEGIASPIGRTAAASLRRTVIDDAVHFTTEAIVSAGPLHNLPALQGIQIARTMYRTSWCSAPPSSITFPPLRPPAIDRELARTWQIVESYISSPVPEQLKLPPQDVIFAHSFFSHMPETTWARWLKALANALAPRGARAC